MTITDSKGEVRDVTGSGQGNLNTVLGAIGTLGAVSGNNGFLGGLFGGHPTCSENTPVSRYEAQQMDTIAAKDAEIARLQSDAATDKKLVEVYAALKTSENGLRDRVDILDRELSAKITAERESRLVSEKEQAVFNQSMIGTTSTMASQIKQLNTIVDEITTNVVPSRKVCDTGCCCNN